MTGRLRDYINSRFLHPTSTGISNIPSLDGVRGIAIIMVVYCHFFAHAVEAGTGFPLRVAGFNISNYLLMGADGVRLFFVLSAFLLSLPYIRHHVYGGTPPSTAGFFKRRALRILPAFLFIVAVYSLLLAVFGQYKLVNPFTLVNVAANALFVQPFLLMTGRVSPDYIPGTWSLAAEVHFYLLLPFIARYFTSIKRAAVLTLFIMVFCALYRYAVNAFVDTPGLQFGYGHNVYAHFDLFALGMLASLIYFKKAAGEIRFPDWWSFVMLAFGAALYLWRLNGGTRYVKDAEILVGLSFFFVLLGAVYGETVIKRALAWSPLRYVGLVSYSMFLMNIPFVWYVLNPVKNYLGITEPLHRFGFNMIIGLPALIALSTVTYLYVERPFLVKKAAGPSGSKIEQPSVEVTPPLGAE